MVKKKKNRPGKLLQRMAPTKKYNVAEAYSAVHQNTYNMASLATTAVKKVEMKLKEKKAKRITLFKIANALNEIAEAEELNRKTGGRGRKPSSIFDKNCNGFRVLNFKRKKDYNEEFARQLEFRRNMEPGKFGVVATAKSGVRFPRMVHLGAKARVSGILSDIVCY